MQEPSAVRSVYPKLAIIVSAQLLGTSLWFSANAAFDDLAHAWGLEGADLGVLTIAVQLGFIVGTLLFALSGIADRYAASRVFATCAVIGAVANLAFAYIAADIAQATVARFVTGFALAGVYPLGMKLVVSWEPNRASEALAWLVGMLTIGTALALMAAVAIFALGDGPHLPRGKGRLQWGATLVVARIPEFRSAALGYFGHMWELYAFWTITPFLVAIALASRSPSPSTIALWSFAIIASGGLGCIVGGYFSRRHGSARVAAFALAGSAMAGAVFPSVAAHSWLALPVLLAWGITVVADSPQFSALSARAAPPHLVGSALAIQNSIGFGITIISIDMATAWISSIGAHSAWLLVPGPVLGLVALAPLLRGR